MANCPECGDGLYSHAGRNWKYFHNHVIRGPYPNPEPHRCSLVNHAFESDGSFVKEIDDDCCGTGGIPLDKLEGMTLSPAAAEQIQKMLDDPNYPTHAGKQLPSINLTELLKRLDEKPDLTLKNSHRVWEDIAKSGRPTLPLSHLQGSKVMDKQTWTNEDIQRVFRYLQDSRELWKAGYTEADELMTEEANKAIESFQKISDWLN